MPVDLSLMQEWLTQFLYPLFRIASMLMVMPIIGANIVPIRVRMGLAMAFTVILVPVLPPMPEAELGLGTWLVVLEQVAIGTVMGFSLTLLIESFVMGGQLISNQMGLGYASVADPANGANVVVLAQLYTFMVILMFLAMDGHLVMFEIVGKSFESIPVGFGVFDVLSLWKFIMAGAWIFSAGMLMAIPCVMALLIVNFSFGIMTKAAPQLNIFAIGFPFTMLLGLFIVWASFGTLGEHYIKMSESVLGLIQELMEVQRG